MAIQRLAGCGQVAMVMQRVNGLQPSASTSSGRNT